MPVDVAIVGAGPAGCAAAIQCRRLGLSVMVLDRSGEAGGLIKNAWSIENEPATGGVVSGPDYVLRLVATMDRFGIAVTQGSVESVHSRFKLEGDFGTLAARAVILATGTAPRMAGIDGEADLAGDALFYEVAPALARNPSSALVVGGGEAAFDYALSLADSGAEVTVAVRNQHHKANELLAKAVALAPLITVLLGTSVGRLEAVESGYRATLESAAETKSARVDIVVVAVGRVPTLPTFNETTIRGKYGRALVGDDETALPVGSSPTDKLTIEPGLYIAGDVRLGSLGQSGIAVGDGLEAAQLAASFLAE